MKKDLSIIGITATIAATVAHAQPIEEEALIKFHLAELNLRSFAESAEFCGYVGLTADEALAVSPPLEATKAVVFLMIPTIWR